MYFFQLGRKHEDENTWKITRSQTAICYYRLYTVAVESNASGIKLLKCVRLNMIKYDVKLFSTKTVTYITYLIYWYPQVSKTTGMSLFFFFLQIVHS